MGLMPHYLDVLAHVTRGDVGVGILHYARLVVLTSDELQHSLVTEVSSQGVVVVRLKDKPLHTICK